MSLAFDHEKLDVYQLGIEFVAKANDVAEALPRGRGYLGDQLQRAALSIVLNIAEGAGKFFPADKAAFYARARGSVMVMKAKPLTVNVNAPEPEPGFSRFHKHREAG